MKTCAQCSALTTDDATRCLKCGGVLISDGKAGPWSVATGLKIAIPLVALVIWLVVPSAPKDPSAPTGHSYPVAPIGMARVKVTAPCAVDRAASNNVIQAIHDSDQEAIDGMVERKQVYILTEGTRFEVSDSDANGTAWGFVRSGRYVGETCYILAAVVGAKTELGAKAETGVYPTSKTSPTAEDLRKQFGIPK